MDSLQKWCIKKTRKNKYHHLFIWILFITILLTIDIGISKDGSIIDFQPQVLDGSKTVFGNRMICKDEYTDNAVPIEGKILNARNSFILNVVDNSESTSYKIFQKSECIFYINFLKYNILTIAYITIISLVGTIIFLLERILLFIQSNDGKKEVYSNFNELLI